ncbi:hypothetical protein CU098_013489, partial [Rhizopus stolonifer]
MYMTELIPKPNKVQEFRPCGKSENEQFIYLRPVKALSSAYFSSLQHSYRTSLKKTENNSDYKKAVRDVSPYKSDDEPMFNFLESLFQATNGESAFNFLFVYPLLKAVGESLAEAINWCKAGFKPVIAQLKKEYNAALVKNRFNPNAPSNTLSTIVNPSILKLTEEEDKA